MRYPEWTGSEPCRQLDPELFFPVSFNALRSRDRVLMIELCNTCPSREPCLMWALHKEREGWWAGTTPTGRERLRRQMGIRLDVPTIPLSERRAA